MLTVDLSSIPELTKKLGPDEIIWLNKIFTDPVILEALEVVEARRIFLRNIGIGFLLMLLGAIVLICWKFTEGNTIYEIIFSWFFNKIGDIIWLSFSIWIICNIIINVYDIRRSFKQELLTNVFPLFGPNFLYSTDSKYSFDVPYELWFNIVKQVSYSTQFQIENIQINSEEYSYWKGSKNHYFTSKVVFDNFRIPTNTNIYIDEDFMSWVDLKGLFLWIFIWFPWIIVSVHYFWIKGLFLGMIIWVIVYFITSWYNRKQVHLENVEFEKLFDVQSVDQVTSRMIITPAFMDRMVTFSKNTGRSGYQLKFQSNILYIGRSLSEDYFCISTKRNLANNIKHLVQFYIDTKESILLIKELNLTYLSVQNINTNNK